MMITEDQIKEALRSVKYPGYSRDIISFGIVKQISARDGAVSISVQLGSVSPEAVQQLKADCERVLRGLPGVTLVHVEVNDKTLPPDFAECSGNVYRRGGLPYSAFLVADSDAEAMTIARRAYLR